MMGGEAILIEYVLPVAVIVSAAATTSTAVLAYKVYEAVQTHERTLFGEESHESYNGVVPVVKRNQQRSEKNRQILRSYEMVPWDDPGDRDGDG